MAALTLVTAPGRQLTRRQAGQALAAIACAGLPIAAEAETADAPWLTLPHTPALPTPTRSDVAAINGTKIFFAQFGAGEPVLLLHGGMGNSSYWGHQIPPLARHFSVIVMDTRGHGRSAVTSAALAVDRIRALGCMPNRSETSRFPMITNPAPSAIPDELPG